MRSTFGRPVSIGKINLGRGACLADVGRRERERYINSFHAFIAKIDDDDDDDDGNGSGRRSHDIHFVALFSGNPDAVPLLLLHGCPGLFLNDH